jgi:hypothetical protein
MNKLKVGDKVEMYSCGKFKKIITIERTTKTLAISGNYRFKRDVGITDTVYETSGSMYTTTYRLQPNS